MSSVQVPEVIISFPVYNSSEFLEEALDSIFSQTHNSSIIILSAYDDGSTDDSFSILNSYQSDHNSSNIKFIINRNETRSVCHGVAYARNRSVEFAIPHLSCLSPSPIIVFFDSDDIMLPTRIQRQVETIGNDSSLICGTCFERWPSGATPRYELWHNNLIQPHQLYSQMFREVTLAQPTWAMTLECFQLNGGYTVGELCEDAVFLYQHIARGGKLIRIDEKLLRYRYNLSGQSLSHIGWLDLLAVRAKYFEKMVLEKHVKDKFIIWGAGRDGKRLFRALSHKWQRRVAAFCDVDEKKIQLVNYHPPPPYRCEIHIKLYGKSTKDEYVAEFGSGGPPPIPILHVSSDQIIPPVVTCVALDRTNGEFESSIPSFWIEGEDYWHFA